MPFRPKLFDTLKSYNKKQLINDILAGLTVAMIALPLSIAIAVASGVEPERGVWTSIIAGFVIAMLGGSSVNISGPTLAFITVVQSIVLEKGIDGLIIATILAGIILVLMGLFKLGSLVKYIPMTITTGFSAGLSISIIIGQIKHFLGLTIDGGGIEGIDKLDSIIKALGTLNWQSLVIGVISLIIMLILPRYTKKVPPSIIVIALGAIAVWALKMNVSTVGDLFNASIPSHANIQETNINTIISLIPEAMIIAMLAAIESMLSSVISDGIINDKTNANTELLAIGIGNIASGIFGGIPATGAIARTTVNIKNGGKTPVSAMVHSVAMLMSMLIVVPFVDMIPMPTIAAILFVVAFSMADWKRFIHICKNATNAETIILIVTFVLTIVFNLMIAISAGLILTAFLFLKEMADSANVRPWTGAGSKIIPKGSAIYELNGPMFFAATDKLLDITSDEGGISVIILRASNMTLLDIQAIKNLEKLVEECKKNNVTVIISHIKDQPLRAMQKVGLMDKIGHENFAASIDDAIAKAEKILEEKAEQERLVLEEKKRKADLIAKQKKKKATEQKNKKSDPQKEKIFN